MIKLRYVNDDWEELWIEGEIEVQGHSLSASQILRALCQYVTGDEPIIEQAYQCIYCDKDLGEDWDEKDFICLECSKEQLL